MLKWILFSLFSLVILAVGGVLAWLRVDPGAYYRWQFRRNPSSEAVCALAQLKDRRAVEPLMKVVRDKSVDWRVRGNSLWALCEIGDKRVIPLLLEEMKDCTTRGEFNSTAAEGLEQLGAVPQCGTEDFIWYTIWQDIDSVQFLGEPAVEPLVAVADGLLEYSQKPVMWRSPYEDVLKTLGKLKDRRAVAALVKVFEREEGRYADTAVRALGKIGGPEAGAILVKALQRHDTMEQHEAIWALQDCPDPRAVEPLEELFNSVKRHRRDDIVRALTCIDDPRATEALFDRLEGSMTGSHVMDLPQKVYEALGRMDGDRAVEVLTEILRGENAGIRDNAAAALVYTGRAQAVAPVREAMRDKDSDVRESVAWALKQFDRKKADPEFVEAFAQTNPEVRAFMEITLPHQMLPWSAKLLIKRLHHGAVPEAIAPTSRIANSSSTELSRGHSNIYEYKRAVRQLAAIGDPIAAAPLLKILNNRDVYAVLRGEAALALANIPDSKAVDALLPILTDDSEGNLIRCKVAEALMKTEDPKATAAVVEVWKDAEEPREVRAAAAKLLAGSGKIEPLVAVLEDPDDLDWVRAEAASQLAATKDGAVAKPLQTATKDEVPLVRHAAARALVTLGTEPDEKALPKPQEDWVRHLGVRFATEWADNGWTRTEFGGIDDREKLRKPAGEMVILALNDIHAVARERAAWTLGDWRDTPMKTEVATFYQDDTWEIEPAVPPLIKTLGDPDPHVRSAAAWVLGEIGDTRAVEALIDLLKKEDELVRVRRSAAWALGEIGDVKAVEALEGVKAGGDALRRTVERALEKLKNTEENGAGSE